MSEKSFVLAIDQGTTSTRAILFDREGRARATAQVPLTQIYPAPGQVEHDPDEIWRSVLHVGRQVLSKADVKFDRRHRHHQSARDDGRVGAGDRQAACQCHRLARPPHRATLRRAGAGGLGTRMWPKRQAW